MKCKRALMGLPVLAAAVIAASSCRRPAAKHETYLAVTSSWIEAAARDVTGRNIPIYRLAPPSQNPRRFRLEKAHLGPLGGCGQLIRFDFQSSLDAKIARVFPSGPLITQIHPQASLCIPSTYEDCCRQVAEHLCATGRIDRPTATRRLKEIHARLDSLAGEALKAISDAGLADAPVVCAEGEESFARWLGLDVEAVFDASAEHPAEELKKALEGLKETPPRLIIAEECSAQAPRQAIVSSAAVPVAFIRSQPAMTPDQRDFDSLLRANISAVLEAAGRAKDTQNQ